MNSSFLLLSLLFAAILLCVSALFSCRTEGGGTPAGEPGGSASRPQPPSVVRRPVDRVGYPWDRDLMERLVHRVDLLEGGALEGRSDRCWLAGISPHDDYLYAARVYAHLYPGIKAKRVVIFGVAHKARLFHVENALVFDTYPAWLGPFGNIPVADDLRRNIEERLDPGMVLVSDEVHDSEHSVEGLLPFLQYYDRGVEIVPILISYMGWERMDELAAALGKALAAIVEERGWKPGVDISFLFSSDCVHYGDQSWGGKNFADFGVDRAGYEKAVARDLRIIHETLEGPLERKKIRDFFSRLVKPEDYHEYAVTWCGRYSVPFGLDCLLHFCGRLKMKPPRGVLLRYGTTLEEGVLDLHPKGSLGVTAPVSLRHWVGFCSIGFALSP